jgi:hypothetical protein
VAGQRGHRERAAPAPPRVGNRAPTRIGVSQLRDESGQPRRRSEEGRSSFTAVVVALALGGLVLLGFAPFDLRNTSASVETLALAVGVDVFLAALCIMKGKRFLAMIGIFVPVISLVGVVRLALPHSLWARRFYKPGSRRLARSEARWHRIDARRRWLSDAIAGAPEVSPAIEPAVRKEEVTRESLGDE